MRAERGDAVNAVEYPMLFSGDMVRAILSGSKTQSRRLVTPRTSLVNGESPCMKNDPEIISAWPNLRFDEAWSDNGPSPAGNPGQYLKVPGPDDSAHRVYSRIQPGDLIWVRETWCQPDPTQRYAHYMADVHPMDLADMRAARREMGCQTHVPWKPSIHMPRWAARLVLRVTNVRAQQIQDITEWDAHLEGAKKSDAAVVFGADGKLQPALGNTCKGAFACLWDSVYGKQSGCSWSDNPWVFALAFKVESRNG